jgi:myo-inositol-1(or 4)-monophosphatase
MGSSEQNEPGRVPQHMTLLLSPTPIHFGPRESEQHMAHPPRHRSLTDTQTIAWCQSLLRQASGITLHYFQTPLTTTEKPDGQGIVTEADIQTENFIKQRILQSNPDALFIAEESPLPAPGSLEPGREVWIIDPIDGTNNFAAGNPYFCISVCGGRIEAGGQFTAEIALVSEPAANRLFLAVARKGATCNGHRLNPRPCASLSEASVSTCFGVTGVDPARVMSTAHYFLTHARSLRVNGAAALDLARTARGDFSIFYERALKPWDLAAGAMIAQEAGLCVTSATGAAFHPLQHESIVVSPSPLHAEILSVLSSGDTTTSKCAHSNTKEV